MKILVFVNHVPDTETKVKVSGDGKTIDPGGVNFMLNPYDEYAVEEGLRLFLDRHGIHVKSSE